MYRPLDGWNQILPDKPQDVISFKASHSAGEVRTYQEARLGALRGLSEELSAEWGAIKVGLKREETWTGSWAHAPLLAELPGRHEMGG